METKINNIKNELGACFEISPFFLYYITFSDSVFIEMCLNFMNFLNQKPTNKYFLLFSHNILSGVIFMVK